MRLRAADSPTFGPAQFSLNTTGTRWVCLNVCGTPIHTSERTLKAFSGTFFSSVLELPAVDNGDEMGIVSIDLDFSVEAVEVLLTTLRAGRSSVNLAFRSLQHGLARCSEDVRLLFDFVGLSWLLPLRIPSEFDDPAKLMSVNFDHSGTISNIDINGLLSLLHIMGKADSKCSPLCAIADEQAKRLDLIEAGGRNFRQPSWYSSKVIYMKLDGFQKLVLDLGHRCALYPTGLLLWIHPPPRDLIHITVSALSEATGHTKVIHESNMPEMAPVGNDESRGYILCRIPITPSLRELYRMFQICIDVADSSMTGTSKLLELELFGDYVSKLCPEVLTIQPQPFNFKDEYADYSHGTFVADVAEV